MDLRKTNAFLTIQLLLLFASFSLKVAAQNNALAEAIQLFDEENYEQAEVVFKKLLDEKPDHLMVNYYYGACRTENGHFGTNEIIYLLNGSIGESPLKTDYYIGVQYHAQNRWEDALKHYKRFKTKATEDEIGTVKLLEKIQMCDSKQNPFVSEHQKDMLPSPVEREEALEEYNPLISESLMLNTANDSIKIETDSSQTTEQIPMQEQSPVKPKSDPINFVVNGEISYLDTAHFQTHKGAKQYQEAKALEKELNDLNKRIENTRKQYGSAQSYSEKQSLGEIILNGETEIYRLQDEISTALNGAKEAEIKHWANASSEEKEAFLKELDDYKKATETIAVTPIEYDTTNYVDPTLLLNGSEIPTPDENTSTDELVYKIQLGAYSRGLPTYVKRLFDKLSYIRKIENYTDEKGIVVYTTGNLTTYEDAVKMQNQVRQEGVEDAYVVPYFNGKRITLSEAKEIEAGK